MAGAPTDEQDTVTVDLLVAGSGAGGMAAALTARLAGLDVLVVEKEPLVGGTTARSGGWLWIPCSPHARRAGIADSKEAARRYLQHEAGNHFDAARVEAFLEAGPRMVELFESRTRLRFVLGPQFSDYHPNAPGALPGGRSICAEPFDGRLLGADLRLLRPPLPELTLFGMMIGSGKELTHFFNVTRSPGSAAYVARLLARYGRDRLVHGRPMRLTNGNALAARLLASALDLGIPIWREAPLVELRRREGRVVGGLVVRQGRPVRVEARAGVLLATGGFPQDRERRARLFPHAADGGAHWSPAPPGNTGDGIRLAAALGAATADELPAAAAWVPVSLVPRRDGTTGVFPHFVDRAKPGVIAVTDRGSRFCNEADSYHDFCKAMLEACRGLPGEPHAWLLADHRAIRRYGLGWAKPFPMPLGPALRSGYLRRGATLGELARTIGLDPARLEATVTRYNEGARRGEDPAFGRGSTAYNRYLGDPAVRPNPCVGPLEKPPFYAVRVVIGDLGTFAGLVTDAAARVLDREGRPIPGLWACGNDMASIMGGNYPGGGITLGPAMTFGYLAALDVARRLGRAAPLAA
ncbi:MAG: FAD-dependent oxidoreductase [Geminicoccaceae bacterium]|nr:FAD-dependent oxidoreductase [Geminicoccaceae bacterium]